MRIRVFVLALCVAALGLTGCQSRAGAAAVVDGHRIATQTLDRYVSTRDTSRIAGLRASALQQLIRSRMFVDLLTSNGGAPTQSELDSYRTQALPDGIDPAAFDQEARRQGLSSAFTPLVIHNGELVQLIDARNIALKKICTISVSVSPRYGAWDRSKLVVNGAVTQADFLTGAAAPAAAGCTLGD